MVTIPYAFGPGDDWDPQGYEEEEEDPLTPGMHLLDDDEEEDEDDENEYDEEEMDDIDDPDDEEDDEDDEDEDAYIDLQKSPLEELEELEDIVTRTERDSLRLSDFTDEE